MKLKHLTMLAGIMLPAVASAATINVDFGRTISTGNINNIATADILENTTDSIADLIDTTGASTGITVTVDPGTGNVGTYENTIGNAHNGPYASAVTTALGVSDADILGDGINVIFANSPTITLSNLDANFTYEVTIYNARGAGTTGSWNYDVTDASGSQDITDAEILDNDEVTTFSNLTADVNGEISLVLSKVGEARGGINFMQITSTPVPEPSSALLIGLAGGLSLLRRKRV
ncbi:PEP-CTERM sorting domain-containing protein [Verrucomicrobiaceae bacterium R5-34]|nr:PEP-CTERM sorting domain-containing protein [Verrucomicrobiaceae bacterium R5-34]